MFGFKNWLLNDMIEFYRTERSTFCDEVTEKLKEMVVAHRVHTLDPKKQKGSVPMLQEGRKVYTEKTEIRAFLDEIGKELTIQREMQGDSCKIDPETGLECL